MSYRSVTGLELARILSGDGWGPQNTDDLPAHVVLWKGGSDAKPISLALFFPIGARRVEKICKAAGITADRFNDLFLGAQMPEWLTAAIPGPDEPTVVFPENPTTKH